MINREDYLMIQKSRDKGCYHADIAEDVGCSVSTVKRALKRQGPPPKRKQGVRVSKLVAEGLITRPDSPKGRLLLQAATLFRDKGYERTTVRDLAKAVGIQSGSIFHHFSSKEQILLAVMEETILELRAVYDQLWLDVLEKAREDKLAVIDPFILRRLLTGAISWTINWYKENGEMDMEELAEMVLTLAIK